MIKIAPSVLSLDYSKFPQQLAALNASSAKWLHFDVMDGHFVPNLTFGPDILKHFKNNSALFLDVHLMVTNPIEAAPWFIEAGANLITFHIEVMENIEVTQQFIQDLKAQNISVGISIKPNTAVASISEFLSDVDLVLVMSVEPGFGGQAFLENSLDKISELAKLKQKHNYHYEIEVDGGINQTTATLVKAAGATVLVAGSYIFNGDIIANIETLL